MVENELAVRAYDQLSGTDEPKIDFTQMTSYRPQTDLCQFPRRIDEPVKETGS